MKRPARSPSRIGGSRLRVTKPRGKMFPTKVPCDPLIRLDLERGNPRKSNSYFRGDVGARQPGCKKIQTDRPEQPSRPAAEKEANQLHPNAKLLAASRIVSEQSTQRRSLTAPYTSFPRASSGSRRAHGGLSIHATSARDLVSIAFKRSFHDSTNDFAPAACRSAPSSARSTPALLIAASVSAASPPSCGSTPSSSP